MHRKLTQWLVGGFLASLPLVEQVALYVYATTQSGVHKIHHVHGINPSLIQSLHLCLPALFHSWSFLKNPNELVPCFPATSTFLSIICTWHSSECSCPPHWCGWLLLDFHLFLNCRRTSPFQTKMGTAILGNPSVLLQQPVGMSTIVLSILGNIC